MKITIIGTGYVGLVTGACLAETGNEVWCVDKNKEKINKLRDGIVPIYEPGLELLVKKGTQEKKLYFTTALSEALIDTDICFLTVDTPPQKDGSPDLTNVLSVAEALRDHLRSPALIVTKSTVPVGTTFKIKKIIQKKWPEIIVASNPEFLKEGSSIQDFFHPDRIVVGVEKSAHAEILKELYEPFLRGRDCFLVMDISSAELAKYAANAMLANRISFMNELSVLCESVGTDIDKIRQSLGKDPRIGSQFLYPGLGYGGSCLPKDVLSLIEMGKEKKVPLSLIPAVHQTNQRQKEAFLQKIVRHFGSEQNLNGKTIAFWGLAFKPETDDIREAPAFFLIKKLLSMGTKIRAFDPKAMAHAKCHFKTEVHFAQNSYECLEEVDALVIATEWGEFRNPDFAKMKQLMCQPVIFDGRNVYETAALKAYGFTYYCFGKPTHE